MSGDAGPSPVVRRWLLVAVIATAAFAPSVVAAPAAFAADPCPTRFDPFVEDAEDDVRALLRADEAAARQGRFSLLDRPPVRRSSPAAVTVSLSRPGRVPLRVGSVRAGARLRISATG